MFDSSSAFDVHPRSIMSDIVREYAMNLFSGRDIVIVRKFSSQPRMILVSERPVSAMSLFRASMSSRGKGSKGETSRDTAVRPSRGARSSLVALSVLSRSTVSPMKSSMYKSTMPLASTGMSTIKSHPIPKGVSSSRVSLGGTLV